MADTSKRWRERAEELNSALAPLLESPTVIPAVIQATKAAVLPELLLALADLLDETNLVASGNISNTNKLLRNHIARMAAVKGLAEGKWDEFDHIIGSLGTNFGDAPGTGPVPNA